MLNHRHGVYFRCQHQGPGARRLMVALEECHRTQQQLLWQDHGAERDCTLSQYPSTRGYPKDDSMRTASGGGVQHRCPRSKEPLQGEVEMVTGVCELDGCVVLWMGKNIGKHPEMFEFCGADCGLYMRCAHPVNTEPPPPPPNAVGKPSMDSECASGCTWSTPRATARLWDSQPRSSQEKSSRGSIDTTKTRSDPQRVGMCSGERPIGAAKGRQTNTMASCPPPPPPAGACRCTECTWEPSCGGGGGGKLGFHFKSWGHVLLFLKLT